MATLRRSARREAAVLIRVFADKACDVSLRHAAALSGQERRFAQLVAAAVEQQLGLRGPSDWSSPPVAQALIRAAKPLDTIVMTNSIYPPRGGVRSVHEKMVHGYGFMRPWPFKEESALKAAGVTIALRSDPSQSGTRAGIADRCG